MANREWGSNKQLDLALHPEGYMVWHDSAAGHLGKGRPDIRALLLWAEMQETEVTEDLEAAGARAAQLLEEEDGVK